MAETEYKKVPIEDKISDPIEEEPEKYGYGVRHVQVFIFFICLTLGYLGRAHLGVTIVAMTLVDDNSSQNMSNTGKFVNNLNNSAIDKLNGTVVYENFTYLPQNETLENSEDIKLWDIYRTYNWPKSIQEMALGSFFLGYCIMMFPMGLVCQRWGGKIPIQIAMFVNAFASISTPWAVAWGGWKALCAVRVLQGLSQAGLYPGMHTLLSNWVPLRERGSLTSYVYTGSGLGTVIAFQLAGILAFSKFGWPSTFWVTGVAFFVGFILLTLFGAATPKDHKTISEAEKRYILGRIADGVETKKKVPWKSVLRSVPVWATFTTHIGNAVCFVFFFVQVPTYMFAVLKLNIRNSGLLSSLPYIASFFMSIFFGVISDFLTNRNIISLKNARKLSNSIASMIPSLCLALVSYTTNTFLAVICFIISLAAQAALHTGWMINYMDLSPNFSGALMATGNTLTNVLVLSLPLIVSNIVIDVTNQFQWRITMFLMAGLTFLTNLIFVLFMSADVQPWNDGENHTREDRIEPEDIKLELQKGEKNN